MIIQCNKLISPITKKVLESSPWLKIANLYTVLAIKMLTSDGISALIQTENFKEPRYVRLEGFEIINQKIPSNWITVFENNAHGGVITMLPASWNYPTFFEDLDEQKPEALKLFEIEARKIYEEYGLY